MRFFVSLRMHLSATRIVADHHRCDIHNRYAGQTLDRFFAVLRMYSSATRIVANHNISNILNNHATQTQYKEIFTIDTSTSLRVYSNEVRIATNHKKHDIDKENVALTLQNEMCRIKERFFVSLRMTIYALIVYHVFLSIAKNLHKCK